MIFTMSALSALYVAITAALWLWVHGRRNKPITRSKIVFIGLLYGICAILSTHFGVNYQSMVLNLRDVAPLAAGMFFHPVAGIIAGLVGGIERYIAGTYFGVGSYTRIACSVSTCLAGFLAAWLNKVFFKGRNVSPVYAFILGAVVEVFHMYVVFITHRNDMYQAFYVVNKCAIPMIIFCGISMACSSVVLYALSGKLKAGLRFPKDEETPLSVKFQIWLLVCTVAMLTSTYFFSRNIQTRMAYQNARNTMEINTADVRSTYYYNRESYSSAQELVKERALVTARAVAQTIDYFGGLKGISDEQLKSVCKLYELHEINIIDETRKVAQSTNFLSQDFDMGSSEQSKPFLDILDGKIDELAQDFMPTGRDSRLSLMYIGVKSADGFIQIALDKRSIERLSDFGDLDKDLGNRHVGESGNIYVANTKNLIIAGDQKNKSYTEIGLTSEQIKTKLGFFDATVYDADKDANIYSLCRLERLEDGYSLLTVLPYDEVYRSRDIASYETGFAGILLFSLVFMLIYILVQRLVVRNLNRINRSLTKITKGDLEEVVDVKTTQEFTTLSRDINLTVDALKGYIAAAEHRMEEELEFARQIQSAALPKVVTFRRDDFSIFATMEPAKEVGGDFYDFFFVDYNKLVLVIADVSGKGIPASLFMMRSKVTIKSLAESGRSPKEIFTRANNALCEGNDADMFVTAWIGIMDLESGKMVCSNAGHEYPAIMRANGEYELLKDKHGLALAAMEDMPFGEYEVQLEPGDSVFVYTDGVPEAINIDEEQYGTDRMLVALNEVKDESVRDMLPAVREDIRTFVGEADQFDDITMLVFKYIRKAGDDTNANT